MKQFRAPPAQVVVGISRALARVALFALALAVPSGCTGHIEGGGVAVIDGGIIGPSSAGGQRGAQPGVDGGGGQAQGGGKGGTGGDPGADLTGPIVSAPADSPRFSRLSHSQWENTVRDLLRLPALSGLSSAFITEPVRGTFDNDGVYLQISPEMWTDYQRAAETLGENTVKDAKKLAAILPANLPTDPTQKAKAFVVGFGQRAYRRPLTDAEVAQYQMLFASGADLVASGDGFADGVQVVVTALLQSPHFLYRTELVSAPVANGRIPLNDYEVASKLSFSLLGTMPDDPLFAAAAAKQLSTRDGVLTQARRLLGLPGAQKTMEDFHSQLLNMAKYDFVSKDSTKFPNFVGVTGTALRTETLTFVKDVILTHEKGLSELLLSSYSFVNSKMAGIYGLASPAAPASGQPDPFVRMDLDPAQRAGLLTQVGFLAAYADGAQPQTILRGAFINRSILCANLPPPPDAFTLPPSTGETNRQRVATATASQACAGCHVALINPPGFALEGYDAIGKVRTTDNGHPVDTSGTYTFDDTPRSFNGGVELSKLIAGSQQAHSCYAQNWLEYLLQRPVDRNSDPDKSLITQLGRRSKAGEGVKAIILDALTTDSFLTRTP